MRCLNKNKRKFYYAAYSEAKEIFDENGFFTGEAYAEHSKPIKAYANISAAQGNVKIRQFGAELSYDRVIVMDAPDVKIDEYSAVWIDEMPILNKDGTTDTPPDYVVNGIARSLNLVSIAVKKVKLQ